MPAILKTNFGASELIGLITDQQNFSSQAPDDIEINVSINKELLANIRNAYGLM